MDSYNDYFKDMWSWIGCEEVNWNDSELIEQEARFNDEGGK